MRVIFSTRFGSHLYGTATPESDIDQKEVFIPSARHILLNDGKEVLSIRPDKGQKEGIEARNQLGDIDIEKFSLRRYLGLLAEGQTIALDMLFATPFIADPLSPPGAGLSTSVWADIWENRHRLLSRRTKAILGYCRQQANKYGIKGSRVAAMRVAVETFEAMVEKHGSGTKLREVWDELEVVLSAERAEHIAFPVLPTGSQGTTRPVVMRHVEVCGRKIPEHATLKYGLDVYRKILDQYGARARQAEENQGVDWKALSHAVRIGRQSVEFLRTGHIAFPRPDRAILMKIKQGAFDYEIVSREIEHLLESVEQAARRSLLPEEPDMDWINRFVMRVYADQVHTEMYGIM